MLEMIKESFMGLSTLEWIGQICGVIAFILSAISYQFKRIPFLIVSMVASLFYALEAGFSLLSPSFLNNAMAIIRNALMLFYLVKYNKQTPMIVIMHLVVAVWIIDLIGFMVTKTYDRWYNWLPPVTITFISLLYNSKNYYVLKLGAFIMEAGVLIYYAIYSLPLSVARQIILVLSVVISVVIMLIKDLKKKKLRKGELSHE